MEKRLRGPRSYWVKSVPGCSRDNEDSPGVLLDGLVVASTHRVAQISHLVHPVAMVRRSRIHGRDRSGQPRTAVGEPWDVCWHLPKKHPCKRKKTTRFAAIADRAGVQPGTSLGRAETWRVCRLRRLVFKSAIHSRLRRFFEEDLGDPTRSRRPWQIIKFPKRRIRAHTDA